MLGKVMKHEWKSVSGVGGLLLCVLLGCTLLGVAYIASPLFGAMMGWNSNNDAGLVMVAGMFGFFGIMIFVLVFSCVTFGMMVYLGIRFCKSMYAEEGYLTQTLPVKSSTLILGKLLVSGIWVLILQIVVFLTIVVLFGTAGIASVQHYSKLDSFGEVLSMISMGIQEMQVAAAEMFRQAGLRVSFLLTLMLATFFLVPFANMMIFFGSFTIGQMFGKHKIVMGFISFFLVQIVLNLLRTILGSIGMVGAVASASIGFTYEFMFAFTLVSNTIFGVGMFFLSNYINKKKLNLN